MYDRRFARVPFHVEVEYRTQGNFLVAYSVNLSTGGMFVETTNPQSIGTELSLRFSVPGVGTANVDGVVAWIRNEAVGPEPMGMGIQFRSPPDAALGALIDQLAAGFRGLKVLILATDARRPLLARAVRSVLATAVVVDARDSEQAEAMLADEVDLVLVDLDEEPGEALATLRLAKVHRGSARPVVAFGSSPETRQRATELGADEVLPAQPAVNELQAAVMRALGRPSSVR